MKPDLVIEARAFVRGALTDVEIGLDLEGGRIAAVKKTLPGVERRRFPGRLLLPSAVDLHVHFRDPGFPTKEDFQSGTRGAALGGVGTVLDMPNTEPLVDRASRFEEKRERLRSKACVDWGLWCTLTPSTPDPGALLGSAVGVKFYLATTTGVPSPGTDADLHAWLGAALAADRLVVVHAETATRARPRSLAEHDAHRPVQGEIAALERVARAAGRAPPPIHVAHASSAATVEAARQAGYSAAATPHHLLLSLDHGGLGTQGKVNPPLRSEAERRRLWDAFVAGRVPILETDHAPHTLGEKGAAFEEAPAGAPGVETAYPLMLAQARRGAVAIETVVRAYSEAPAARLGLLKGRIEVGYDADFFVVDPHRLRRIRGDELATRCGWTPFEGWDAPRVETHFLRGEPIVEDRQFVGRPGRGRAVRVSPASEARRGWATFASPAAEPMA